MDYGVWPPPIVLQRSWSLLASLGCISCGSGGGGGVAPSNPPPTNPNTHSQAGPAAGNPSGSYAVPVAASAVDVSTPDHVVGTGTAASCTADAFIQAVALGGKITFNCGAAPITLTLTLTLTLNRPAKVFNDKPDVVAGPTPQKPAKPVAGGRHRATRPSV